MRVRRSARPVAVVLVIALLAGLLPTLGVATSRRAVTAAPAAQAGGCVVGTELVTNGSFEEPGISGEENIEYLPTSWDVAPGGFGAVYAVTPRSGRPLSYDGDVYIYALRNGLSQALPTAGLGGATLTVSYRTSADYAPVVRVGGQDLSSQGSSPITNGRVFTGTVTLPTGDADDTTLLTLGGTAYGGTFDAEIDAVSVRVSACPAPPSATLTVNGTTTGPVVLRPGQPFTYSADVFYPEPGPLDFGGLLFSGADQSTGGFALIELAAATENRTGQITLSPAEYAASGPRVLSVQIVSTESGSTLVSNRIPVNRVPVLGAATAPAPVTATSAAGAAVTFTPPTGTDYDTPDTASTVSCTAPVGSAGATAPVSSGDTFPVGTTTVSCTAADTADATLASDPVTFGVTVLDGTLVAEPSALVVTLTEDGPSQSVSVTTTTAAPFTLAAWQGQVDSVASLATYDSAEGASVVNGEPLVLTFNPLPNANGTVTDPDFLIISVDREGERTSVTVPLTLTVTAVNDAPVLTDASVPASRTVAATSGAGATVTYSAPTATDVDGTTPTVTCTAPAVPGGGGGTRDVTTGGTFPLGATVVTCTASDGTLTDTATFTVTVTDQSAPVFTGLPNVTVGATSNYGAVVTYALPTATDNAGTPTVSCLPASGSQFPIGTTTVTCTASDGTNVTTGTFVVTVTNNGFRDPRDPRPGASPITQPPPTPTPRPARPPRG